jgi:hypothetical protein
MNNNIKIRTALKFLLKKIFAFTLLNKIFAKYPRFAKLLKYLNITLFCISTLNFILKYIFSIELDILDKLGITMFLSHLLGKFTAYYKTLAEYISDRVPSTEMPKPVKTEVSKPNTPDWDYEFFKKRKEFYERVEKIKAVLANGTGLSDEDAKFLNNALKVYQKAIKQSF